MATSWRYREDILTATPVPEEQNGFYGYLDFVPIQYG